MRSANDYDILMKTRILYQSMHWEAKKGELMGVTGTQSKVHHSVDVTSRFESYYLLSSVTLSTEYELAAREATPLINTVGSGPQRHPVFLVENIPNYFQIFNAPALYYGLLLVPLMPQCSTKGLGGPAVADGGKGGWPGQQR